MDGGQKMMHFGCSVPVKLKVVLAVAGICSWVGQAGCGRQLDFRAKVGG